jgi:GINS complex subunit 1
LSGKTLPAHLTENLS